MRFYSKLFEMLPESESVFSVVLTSSMLAMAFAPRDCIKLLDMSYKTNHERICDRLEFLINLQKFVQFKW